MGNKKISVCLISPHPLFIGGFRARLETGFRVQVHELETTAALAEQVERLPRAQVYAVDACAQPVFVQPLISLLLNRFPQSRVLAVADEFADEAAFELLRLGIKGILRYADADTQFSRAVEGIAHGGYWVPRAILSQFVEQLLTKQRQRRVSLSGGAGISRREEEILDCLLDNLSNKEIGNRLNISERTVKFHVSNLLAKYRVQRRADLILLSFHSNRFTSQASAGHKLGHSVQ